MTGGTAQDLDFVDLKAVTYNQFQAVQALEAVELDVGSTPTRFLVLGCSGGRVRVVQPGAMRSPGMPHDIGTAGDATQKTADEGHGIAALDTRKVANDTVDIVFGTFLEQARGDIGPYPGTSSTPAPLDDREVMHSVVRKMRWSPGGGFTTAWTLPLYPNYNAVVGPRGGFGVAGAKFADVLPDAGVEVLVTTMAGDFFILSEAGSVLLRTHVPGALGMYSSIAVADLNANSDLEIYLAGTHGIFRFAKDSDLLQP